MKLQQDFLGCANRIRAELTTLEDHVTAVMEHWRDATASEFQHQHLQVLSDTLRRLMITLQEAGELSAKCGRILSDEDR
jgi:uncharacterized protein YukE